MNLGNEVIEEKEKIQAAMREAEQHAWAQRILEQELIKSRLTPSSPILVIVAELQPIISEAIPYMQFSNPKIVRRMSNGCTYARMVQNSERPDAYSFDVQLFSDGTGKGAYTYNMWVFRDGAISFNCDNITNKTWADMQSKGIDASVVRSKIIESMALWAAWNENKCRSASKSAKCYIATAVYGSYDCPEVCVLRRYRDHYLKKNIFGRIFVKVYYAISPTLVEWFGHKTWFTSFWRYFLNKKVSSLKEGGYSDEQYDDKDV